MYVVHQNQRAPRVCVGEWAGSKLQFCHEGAGVVWRKCLSIGSYKVWPMRREVFGGNVEV